MPAGAPTDIPANTVATNRPPPLPKELAEEVARWEKAVEEALAKPENPDLIADAIPKAEAVLKARLARQGETWWETFDARQQLTDLRRLELMPAEQRTALAEARRLTDQMFQFRGQGSDSNALEVAQTACKIRGEILGHEHPEYALSLNNVARCLNALPGREAEALAKYEAALATYERLFAGDHPTTAALIHNVAYCLSDLPQRVSDALPKYQAALEMQQRLFPAGHADVARSLNNIAFCLKSLGRLSEALPKYEAALAMRQRLAKGDAEDVAASLNNLALCLQELGQWPEALPKHEAALAMRRRLAKGDDEDVASSLNNLATCLKEMGRPAEAYQRFEQALAVYQRLFKRDHQAVARGLNNLAACLDDLGRPAEALAKYEAALAMQQRLSAGDSSDVAASLNNIALWLLAQQRASEALPKLELALAMRQRLFPTNHSDVALSLHNLGACLRTMHRLPEALERFEAALAMRQRLFGENHPEVARSLNAVATCLHGLKRMPEAATKYEVALAMRRRLYPANHPAVAWSLNDMAVFKVALGECETASRLLLESSQARWGHLTRNFPFLSEQQKQRFLSQPNSTQPGFEPDQALLSLVFEGHAATGSVGLRGVLLSKQLLFEVARQESSALSAAVIHAPADWQANWFERERLRRQYATAALQGHVEAADLCSLADRIEQLDQQLRQGNPAYAQTARLEQVSLEDVAAALRPGEALLEYVRYRPYDFVSNQWAAPHYGAFVLSSNAAHVEAVELGEAQPIDDAVQQFRSATQKAIAQFRSVQPGRGQVQRSEQEVAWASSALRWLLWEPIAKHLPASGRVRVAPDGLLSLVPYEALARETPSSGWRYLGEERELAYVGTGRDLARLALSANALTNSPKTAVLIGNPAFAARPREVAAVLAELPTAPRLAQAGQPEGSGTLGAFVTQPAAKRLQVPRDWAQNSLLDRLTEQARNQLERLDWTVTSLTNQFAIEEAVLRVASPRILQFATHGYLLDKPDAEAAGWDNPLLRSMLLLAGVNQWQPDQSVFYRVGGQLLSEAQAHAKGLPIGRWDTQQGTPHPVPLPIRWGEGARRVGEGDGILHRDDPSVSARQPEIERLELADGILTAYEVSGMNLSGTELVNLTACETGLGEVTVDGVAGLRQGFLLAGARSLTMTMWEVPAAETAQQIGDFYARWLGGSGNSKETPDRGRYLAFRAAQLAALAHTRETYGAGHPFHWAGVVYVGDPGDLPRTANATE